MNSVERAEHIGTCAAQISLVEIGLGSLLHAFKVPFAGMFLSLNQIFFLSFTIKQKKLVARTDPFYVSTITAMLKSLSPAGKKLTPMLGISMQGFLYTIGTLFFGLNIVGALVGSVIASVWSFVQPIAIYFIIFGSSLFVAFERAIDSVKKVYPAIDMHLAIKIFWGLVLFKMVFSVFVTLFSFALPTKTVENIYAKIENNVPQAKNLSENEEKNIYTEALKDLLSPLFIVSLLFTFFVFLFVETDKSNLIWITLRPLAVGYLLFLFLRMPRVKNILFSPTANNPTRPPSLLKNSMQKALKKLL